MQRHLQNEVPSSLPCQSSVPEGFPSYLCLCHLCDLISPTSSHLPQPDPVASVTSLTHLCIYTLCLDSNPASIYLAGSRILSGDRLGKMSIKQNRLPTHPHFLMPFFFPPQHPSPIAMSTLSDFYRGLHSFQRHSFCLT